MVVKILKILYWIVNVVIISALLTIHFVLKERSNYNDVFSYRATIMFYSFPLPIIILICLGLTLFLSRKMRRYNLGLTGVLLLIWLGRSFKIHIPETTKNTDLEVVFWNASRDNGFQTAFYESKSIPDILVLVESKKNDLETLQLKYSRYFFYKLKREIYIFSKTKVVIESDSTSKYNSTVINFKTKGINFYAVDVAGSTDVPRNWELDFVNKNIKATSKTIILGDFNLPFESKFLHKIKSEFNHAFNEKGNGFRETWFWNLPILSLDHIWVSKDLKILKTQKINTFESDHCMLKTYIRN